MNLSLCCEAPFLDETDVCSRCKEHSAGNYKAIAVDVYAAKRKAYERYPIALLEDGDRQQVSISLEKALIIVTHKDDEYVINIRNIAEQLLGKIK